MTFLRTIAMVAVSSLAIHVHAAEADLRSRVEAHDGWVAYDVPIVQGVGSPCCIDDARGGASRRACALDGRNWNVGNDRRDTAPPTALTVYWHVNAGRVDAVRAFAASCPIDSATEVHRLSDVDGHRSSALVAQWLATNDSPRRDVDTALAALAYHADAGALQSLDGFAQADHARAIREPALFWLGQTRGSEGAAIVERIARNDKDDGVREHAVFALAQAHVDDAYARVRSIARSDTVAGVRGKALFWMAQMDAPEARNDIIAAMRDDPADGVREEAVFALSQLDGEAADEALIAVVRGDYPRAAKEKALFWLGQSGSQRALDFIDSVLGQSPPPRS